MIYINGPLMNHHIFVHMKVARVITRVVGTPGSLRFRLARDTLGVMVLNAFAMSLGFLISMVLARLLGVWEFGLYAFAMSLLGLLSALASFGFPQLLVREIAAYRVKGEWGSIRGLLHFSQRTALGASLALALLVGLGLWLFSDRLSPRAEATLSLGLVALPFMALIQLQSSALRGFDRILESQIVNEVLRPLSFLVLTGVVWLLDRTLLDATVAVGLQAVAAGVTLLAGWFLLRRYANAQVLGATLTQSNSLWLRSALWLLLLALLNLIPQHSGVLLLGIMRGSEEVALYKVAYQAASLVPFGLMAFNTAIAPTLAQLYAAGNRRGLRRVMIAASGVGTAFALPLVLLFTMGGNLFLKIAFGGNFRQSFIPLFIMTVGQFMFVALGPLLLLLVMINREDKATFVTAISAGLNVVMNMVFIPIWGVSGAALATAISLVLLKVQALFYILLGEDDGI